MDENEWILYENGKEIYRGYVSVADLNKKMDDFVRSGFLEILRDLVESGL